MLTHIFGYLQILAPIKGITIVKIYQIGINPKSVVFTTTQFFKKMLALPGMN